MVGKHEDMELADKRDKSMKPLNRVSSQYSLYFPI